MFIARNERYIKKTLYLCTHDETSKTEEEFRTTLPDRPDDSEKDCRYGGCLSKTACSGGRPWYGSDDAVSGGKAPSAEGGGDRP